MIQNKPSDNKEVVVITFGTFDLFHIGHLNILNRAKQLGTHLIVGVSSDDLNKQKKNKLPVFSQDERLTIIKSLKFVDQVFIEESLERKAEYIKQYKASILVMGDDWKGRFDWIKHVKGCEHINVIYLPRTEGISSSQIIEHIKTTTKNN